MRSILTHTVALSAGLAIGSIAAVLILAQMERTATVEIVNESRELIPIIRIRNSETGGTLAIDDLAPNARETLRLFVRGEASYAITVRFSDGTTLETERYFETGYTITERIYRDRIEPEFSTY